MRCATGQLSSGWAKHPASRQTKIQVLSAGLCSVACKGYAQPSDMSVYIFMTRVNAALGADANA